MPRRTILKTALVVFLVVAAALFIYLPSYSRYRELKSEAERLDSQLKDLQAQVLALQKEKQLLRNDKGYLESVIREELGLVQPGEVVYEFEKTPSHKSLPSFSPKQSVVAVAPTAVLSKPKSVKTTKITKTTKKTKTSKSV